MQRIRRGDAIVTSARAASMAKRGRWSFPIRVTTALSAASLAAGLAVTFGTAASAAPAAPDAPPAHSVAPGAVRVGTVNEVYYTGTDNAVWVKVVGGAGASSLGGRLISAPSPVNAGGTVIIFGQGTDHGLWEKVDGGPWMSLGGVLTSKPGAAAVSATSYAVYVRGSDGQVWGRIHTGSRWGPWFRVGGRVLSGTGPTAAARGTQTWVMVVGTNRELFIQHAGVTGFSPAGGITNSSPALVDINSSLVGYARGTNNAMWFHSFITPNTGWHSLGGIFTSGMGGASSATVPFGYGLGGNSQVFQNANRTPNVFTQVTP